MVASLLCNATAFLQLSVASEATAQSGDVRFEPDGRTAFITGSGVRGSILAVVSRRALPAPASTTIPRPSPDNGVEVTVSGRKGQRPDGRGMEVAADGLAPTWQDLTFQPLTGRTLYRIVLSHLMSEDAEAVGQKVEKAGVSCADGLLMSRDGPAAHDLARDSAIEPWEGDRARTLVTDPNLRWADSIAEGPTARS